MSHDRSTQSKTWLNDWRDHYEGAAGSEREEVLRKDVTL